MRRREFVYTGLGAAMAMRTALATAMELQAPAGRKLKIDINSKHLQWLRSADEVADAVVEMNFDGVDLNVAPYPGHIDPAKVAQDLPAFANALHKRELRVVSMTTPIVDADSANADAILKAASSAGITHYGCAPIPYDKTKPIVQQLDALRPRLTKLVALSAKYKMTALLDTSSSGDNVGAALWDWLFLLKDLDPTQVGLRYDASEQLQKSGWELNLRAAGKYLAAISVRDFAYEQDLGLKGEGGPYVPPPPGLQPAGGGRGGGAPGGGAPGGRGRGGGPPDGAGRGGGGRGAANAAPIISGPVNGWKLKQVPVGTGMINWGQFGLVLKDMGFAGPVEIKIEYSNGGAQDAQDKITLPRAQVLGTMKRDLLALRSAFTRSGLM